MKIKRCCRLLSLVLCAVLCLSCASAAFALEPWELQWALGWAVPNFKVENKVCTGMQGMAADTRYIYTAKTSSGEDYCVLIRTDPTTDQQVQLPFYESPGAAVPTPCTVLSHANDLEAVETGNSTALFVATTQKKTALARVLVQNNKAILTGWFQLLRADGTTAFSASSVSFVGRGGGKLYFLIKNALVFYACVIDETAAGGTAQSPTPVICPKLFEIDTRNAQFYNTDGTTYRIPNLETWTNQGCTIDPATKILYVPLWNGSNDNAIVLFDASPYVTTAAMTAAADSTSALFPQNVSFRIWEPTQTQFEIESCAFRAAPDGSDLLLYFNNNANNISREGIYITNYTQNSVVLSPLVTADTLVYTVKYKANGGSSNSALSNWDRMNATRHLGGVPTNLRPNTFLPPEEGYLFYGWTLYRGSDKTWLYTLPDGTQGWYQAGKEPAGAERTWLPDRTTVDNLTTKNGDTITAWAQWDLPRYTVTFDPAGGTAQFSTMILHMGDAFGVLPEASMDGMQFDGWFLPDGTAVTAETVFDRAEPLTLTAHWTPLAEEPQGGLRGFFAFFQRILDWFRSLFSAFQF